MIDTWRLIGEIELRGLWEEARTAMGLKKLDAGYLVRKRLSINHLDTLCRLLGKQPCELLERCDEIFGAEKYITRKVKSYDGLKRIIKKKGVSFRELGRRCHNGKNIGMYGKKYPATMCAIAVYLDTPIDALVEYEEEE